MLAGQGGQLQHIANRPPPPRSLYFVESGEIVQILPHAHVLVDPEAVRHITDQPSDFARMSLYVMPGYRHAPGRWEHERSQHFHSGRLPRSVRSDKTKNLSAANLESEVTDRSEAAVLFGHAL